MRYRLPTPPPPPSWADTPQQSEKVLACLTRAGLAHVSAASAGSAIVWSGYDGKVQNFVIVTLYPTKAAAAGEARKLSAEEVAPAGRYVVGQSIAPYAGSPVPAVVTCLGGKPPKTKKSTGGKHRKAFTF